MVRLLYRKFVIAEFIKVCKDLLRILPGASQNFVFVLNMFYCNVCFVYCNHKADNYRNYLVDLRMFNFYVTVIKTVLCIIKK